MPTSKTDSPSRPLSPTEILDCRARLKRPRTLHGCWSVGQTLAAAMDRHRAEFGRRTLQRYAKRLRTTEDILRHMLRLGRSWTEEEVEEAQAAGLGFRAVQFLVVLDSRGQSDLRRRLVAAFCNGNLDRTALFRKARTAKAKPSRMKAGPRLRALLDLRRTLASRLNRVRARLQSALMLWPAAQRPEVRRLSAQLKQIHDALMANYQEAAQPLREERKEDERRKLKLKRKQKQQAEQKG